MVKGLSSPWDTQRVQGMPAAGIGDYGSVGATFEC